MRKHLAIFSLTHTEQVLNGTKVIELRASQKRIPPFSVVNIGDLVYIKPTGKEIIGQFKIKKIISFEGIIKEDWKIIESIYNEKLDLKNKEQIKYLTLIFIDQVEKFITPPVKIQKSDQRGWMVLNS
ncbi:hypothetical protein HY025_04050 [Candidatus Daviesbacteria bacterium]|nr:hypothetical protein [Candidatus Daviesbacteria bacterium]